ncbi:MAG TPA: hypothetical protein QGF63_02685 [Alphaproteobacteria bacterium]|jgi:hypothetical protein|nr:hypothetical protein [Alphaproteobacteria bacterium]MDP6271461.1 hypothetical protein [Alphaproteobacteria bacterium]MDP7164580.1 hypothetical protein [Alphaproteobacteria bacterium]HJM48734.1 hypothetical protein [Alphaproteobacteria bacterium]|tara:strand:+ start:147 stop:356 length:210 start_codon:yes stop_codon:yes gene_type:complete
MNHDPQTELQAQARELLGRELSPDEIATAGIRFPTMLRCLRLLREWSQRQSGTAMAPIFRVPTGAGRGD